MLVRFLRIGSSCSPSSVRALPGTFGLADDAAPALPPASLALPSPLASVTDDAVGVSSKPAKMASQSWPSALELGPGPAVLLAADVVESEAKSKLLSVPKGALFAAESLLGWLGGGLLSNTGLKSSRPDREMLAKSSSAEPSLASSRPSKSSSSSSNAFLGAAGAAAAAAAVLGRLLAAGEGLGMAVPKIASALELLRWVGGAACFSLQSIVSLLILVKGEFGVRTRQGDVGRTSQQTAQRLYCGPQRGQQQ